MKKAHLLFLLIFTVAVMGAMGLEIDQRLAYSGKNAARHEGDKDLRSPPGKILQGDRYLTGEYPGKIEKIPSPPIFPGKPGTVEPNEGDSIEVGELPGVNIPGLPEGNAHGLLPIPGPDPGENILKQNQAIGNRFLMAASDQNRDLIHFLLAGYDHELKRNDLMLMISLDTGNRVARFMLFPVHTVVTVDVDGGKKLLPLSDLARYGKDMASLARSLEELSGIKAGCYIRLNNAGLASLIDMVGGVNHYTAGPFSAGGIDFTRGNNHLNGESFLKVLADLPLDDFGLYHRKILLETLLAEADKSVNAARMLPSLLWVGIKHVKTDMSLRDFYQLRKATNAIEPGDFTLEYFQPEE